LFNRHSNIDLLCIGLFAITIFSKASLISQQNYKLYNIERFSNIEKNTRICFFVIMFIFTRNIDNAI
jgi:hypothetical protein